MAIFTQINGSHTRPGVLDKDHVAALLAQDGDATPWQLVGEHATLAVDVFHVRLEWNDKGVWVPSIGACIPPGQQDASQRLSAPGTGTTVGAVLHLERKLGGDDDPVIVWSVDNTGGAFDYQHTRPAYYRVKLFDARDSLREGFEAIYAGISAKNLIVGR